MPKWLLATKMSMPGQSLFENWQDGNGLIFFHPVIWSQDTSLSQVGHLQFLAKTFLSGLDNTMAFPVFRFYYLGGIFFSTTNCEIKRSL